MRKGYLPVEESAGEVHGSSLTSCDAGLYDAEEVAAITQGRLREWAASETR